MYDLAAIELHLRARRKRNFPPWMGRAIHAVFLRSLEEFNPSFSKDIHDGSGVKPFTVSNLLGASVEDGQLQILPSEVVRVRLTSLHPDVTALLLNGILPVLTLDGFTVQGETFQIEQLIDEGTVWTGTTDYMDLLNQASHQERKLKLRFVSPTSFKSTLKHYMPLPYPDKVFQSLLMRWNAFAPVTFPRELLSVLNELLAVMEHRVHSENVVLKGRQRQVIGFTGEVTYHILTDDETVIHYLNALADFALYSGVGVQTAVGLGQVRRVGR